MKYIYVAGPYSIGDVVFNIRNAIEAGDRIAEMGYVPYVPHLTMLWHIVHPHDISFWYALDKEWLLKCDAVVRLPGESRGADAEVELALANGIPVFYSTEDL